MPILVEQSPALTAEQEWSDFMKCKHGQKYRNGYVQCQKDGSVRKDDCKKKCCHFEPTFWDKLMYLIANGYRWRP